MAKLPDLHLFEIHCPVEIGDKVTAPRWVRPVQAGVVLWLKFIVHPGDRVDRFAMVKFMDGVASLVDVEQLVLATRPRRPVTFALGDRVLLRNDPPDELVGVVIATFTGAAGEHSAVVQWGEGAYARENSHPFTQLRLAL